MSLCFSVWLGVMGAVVVVGFISFVINCLTPCGNAHRASSPDQSLANNLYYIYAMYLEQSKFEFCFFPELIERMLHASASFAMETEQNPFSHESSLTERPMTQRKSVADRCVSRSVALPRWSDELCKKKQKRKQKHNHSTEGSRRHALLD